MANILQCCLIGRNVIKRLRIGQIGIRKTSDFCSDKIGKREIVGYGWNGCANYADRVDYPFPAIRFKEPSKEICALREKETSDWKKLTLEEKKCLYRYSFCQTFSEMKASTGEWKFVLGLAFWIVSMALTLIYAEFAFGMYQEYPSSFDEENRRKQLKRMLDLEVNPVDGLASQWDYENDRWK